jgi:hypothetical protein
VGFSNLEGIVRNETVNVVLGRTPELGEGVYDRYFDEVFTLYLNFDQLLVQVAN